VDKKKVKIEKIKKGYKTPFLRNSSYGQPTQNEPRMLERLGKIPRQEPIKS
jgi:hypothetical protein